MTCYHKYGSDGLCNFCGVPEEVDEDYEVAKFAKSHPYDKQPGDEINMQGYVLRDLWEYHTKECLRCLCGQKHTVMEHAENVERYKLADDLIKKAKPNLLLKPLWTPETQHCSYCYSYKPHSAGEHLAQIKKEKDQHTHEWLQAQGNPEYKELQKPNWHVLSSKKCYKCKQDIPHTNQQHYQIVEAYEMGTKKADKLVASNEPVVAEVRAFTYTDQLEVEKRRLSSTLTKQMEAYDFMPNPGHSHSSGDPAKAPRHVQFVDESQAMDQPPLKYYWYDNKDTNWSAAKWKQQYMNNFLNTATVVTNDTGSLS